HLVALKSAQLQQLELPDKLYDALIAAGKIKTFEARRRHMQYIGRLMREVDAAPLRQQLEKWRGNAREHQARLRLVERWRERLLADEAGLAEFLQAYPQTDAQRLRILVRNTRHEAASGKPPRNLRALFQELQDRILEAKQGQ
ncbi:MAG: ribosome biogenesis factor YjgA, partial [Burkholderiales bacterium]